MNWGILSLGFLLLFSSSFFDNLRGPLLPILANQFHLTHSDTSLFLIMGSLGGIVATFLLIPFTRATSERNVLITLLSFAFSVIAFSFLFESYVGLLVFGTGIGVSVATLGAMANLVTMQGATAEKRGHALSLLHTMYGLGSFLAPNVVSVSLISFVGWRAPFLILLLFLLAAFILAQKVLPKHKSKELEIPEKASLNRFQIFTVLLFSTYVAGEVMVSMWMVTYLVEAVSLTVTDASTVLGHFFLVMMATRLFTFFSLKPKFERPILFSSLLLSVLFLALGLKGGIWAFPLVGVFGPFFPLLLSRVTHLFRAQGKAITLWIIGINAVFIVVSHRFVGVLADRVGLSQAYWTPWFLLVLALFLFSIFLKREAKAH